MKMMFLNRKSEGRNPRPERNPRAEIRIGSVPGFTFDRCLNAFGLRTSDFFRISGIRASGLGLGLAILLTGHGARAQSGVPGPDEYERFSHFITDRNIFDPNRQPHDYNSRRTYTRTRTRTPRGTPAIQFVGTMSYEKGKFGFFSGNNADLSQVAQAGDKLQGYTITSITATNVMLTSADNKEQIELLIGDGLRQENNKWIFSKAGELPTEPAPVSSSSSGSSSSSSSSSEGSSEGSSSTPAALPPGMENNDVLKRLMEKRAKENQ